MSRAAAPHSPAPRGMDTPAAPTQGARLSPRRVLALAALMTPLACQSGGPAPSPVAFSQAGIVTTHVGPQDTVDYLISLGRSPLLVLEASSPAPGECNPFAEGGVSLTLAPPAGGALQRIDVRPGDPGVSAVPGGYVVDTSLTQPPLSLDQLGAWQLELWAHCAGQADRRLLRSTTTTRLKTSADPEASAAQEAALALAAVTPLDLAALMKQATAPKDAMAPTLIIGQVGRDLSARGRFDDAAAVASAGIALATSSGLASEQARLLNLLHDIQRMQGDLRGSQASIEQALALDRRWAIWGRLPIDLWCLAWLQATTLDHTLALQTASEARLIAQKVGDAKYTYAARLLEIMELQILGHHETVEANLASLIAPEGLDDAALINNAGWVDLVRAETQLPPGPERDAALDRAARAFELSQELYAEEAREHDVANALASRAWVHLLRGDVDAAAPLQAQARSLAHDAEPVFLRFLERVAARTALERGEVQLALRYSAHVEAQAIEQRAWQDAGASAFDQGEALLRLGDRAAALDAFDRALQWGRREPDLGSPLHRAPLLASLAPWEQRAVQLRLELSRPLEALWVVEAGSRDRRWIANHAGGAPASSDDKIAAQRERRRALARLPDSPQVLQQREAADAQLQKLWAQSMTLGMPGDVGALSMEELTAQVPAGGLLLRFASFPGELVVWQVDSAGLSVRRQPIPRRALAAQIAAFARSCEAGAPDAQLGAALSQALLGSAANDPPPALALVTEGPLRSLPWSCLPAGGGRLISRSTLRHQSGLIPNAHAAATGAPLIISDPRKDLPNAHTEGAWLKAEVLTGALHLDRDQANLAAVRAALPTASQVHIASHGFTDSGQPWLSHLGLSRGEQLSLMDVGGLTIGARLVFLNACEAGSVAADGGTEGLADGFLDAGASHVIATRWAVPDTTSLQIARDFYKASAGGQVSDEDALASALRAAIEAGVPSTVWSAYVLLSRPPELRQGAPQIKDRP